MKWWLPSAWGVFVAIMIVGLLTGNQPAFWLGMGLVWGSTINLLGVDIADEN